MFVLVLTIDSSVIISVIFSRENPDLCYSPSIATSRVSRSRNHASRITSQLRLDARAYFKNVLFSPYKTLVMAFLHISNSSRTGRYVLY